MFSPAVPLSHHPHLLLLLFILSFLYCSSLLHAPSRSRYRIAARISMHRCALSRARACVARSRTFTQPRIEHRLPALTGRVQRSLADRTVSLYLALVDPRGLHPPLSFSLFLSPSCIRALASHRVSPRLSSPLVTTDTSYLVLSLPASRPFLLSSFPPFLPPIDSSCFCAFPPCRPFFATRSLLCCGCRYSWSYLSFSLLLSLCSFFLRFPHRWRCRTQRSRAAMRTTQMHALDCSLYNVGR